MTKLKLLIPVLFFITILSCKKEQNTTKLIEKTPTQKILTVDSFPDSLVLNKFDVGCLVSYAKKGTSHNENILMQGAGIPAEIGRSLFVMKIDGTLQLFHSNDERDVKTVNENLIEAKVSNKDYEVEVITHIGKSVEESDSTEHFGTIKITRKKDNSVVSIDFVGGVAC
ncbi:hypothetical protein VUJ46_08235 [Chryseobacterium sp. MYb264]|uniref:hypothetical protein n=1 Tax=Chryseobacterium sp. MYb264 TaxID=2745153 RepID=UPI002E166EE7|nr:hypothetical protein VUJ46_08235 [Chryseobacterium sp. MYb264]